VTERPPKTCQFFRLPQELRDAIYIHRFVRAVDDYIKPHLIKGTEEFEKSEKKTIVREPPLARVNKQLRREVLEVYYTMNNFIFSPGSTMPWYTGHEFTNFHKRHLLRNVCLEFPVTYTKQGEKSWWLLYHMVIKIAVGRSGRSTLTASSDTHDECMCGLAKLLQAHMDFAQETDEGSGLMHFVAGFEAMRSRRYTRTSEVRPLTGDEAVCGECGKKIWKQ